MDGARKPLGRVRAPVGAKAPPASAVPARKPLGTVKPGARASGHSVAHAQSCCAGLWLDGMWHHDLGCPRTVTLWKRRYARAVLAPDDWPCPHGCVPVETSSGWTHHHQCPFWTTTTETPF